MERTIEQRLMALEAQSLAYGVVLAELVQECWPHHSHRAERRDTACKAIEALFPSIIPGEHGHHLVQKALGEIEALFGRFPPPPG